MPKFTILKTLGNYQVARDEEDGGICAINTKTGYAEMPIRHYDGYLYWERPEWFPKRVRRETLKVIIAERGQTLERR